MDQGYIGQQGMVDNAIGEIVIDGSIATGVHVAAGKATRLKHTFRKKAIAGGWTSPPHADPRADHEKALIQQSGATQDEFLAETIESVSGEKVTDAVWEPMLK
ncbi:MAG: hypothetical protein R3F30_16050 [Planctomycetota bacterium]